MMFYLSFKFSLLLHFLCNMVSLGSTLHRTRGSAPARFGVAQNK